MAGMSIAIFFIVEGPLKISIAEGLPSLNMWNNNNNKLQMIFRMDGKMEPTYSKSFCGCPQYT